MDEFFVMKVRGTDGEILWNRYHGGPDLMDDRAWGIAIGPDDHPIVTGVSVNSAETASFLTIKCDKDDGNEIWRRTVAGAINDQSRAGWIGCDDAGNPIIANRTWAPGVSYDVVLQKYAAAAGTPIWQTQYDSPTSAPDDIRHMILDADHNPLVSGVSDGDYMALKFDGSNGDFLWHGSYDGSASGYDVANCVALASSGDIVVSGFSTGDNYDWDVATVAFDPASGSQSWALRFNGDDELTDEGRVLAVAPQGDVYVGGYSYATATGMDLLAVRYQEMITAVGGSVGLETALMPVLEPNPAASGVAITVMSDHDLDEARVIVFDAQGRRLRTLPLSVVGPGETRIGWDGRRDDGHLLPEGVYFVRLVHSGGSGAAAKAIILR